MSAAEGSYVVVARTPAADAAFVRYPGGGLWLLMGSGPRPATEDEVGRALLDFNFELVNQEFADWEAIQAELNRVARRWLEAHPALQEDVADFDLVDLERILTHAAKQPQPTAGLRALAAKVLYECPLAKDPSVYGRLLELAGVGPVGITAGTAMHPITDLSDDDIEAQRRVWEPIAA